MLRICRLLLLAWVPFVAGCSSHKASSMPPPRYSVFDLGTLGGKNGYGAGINNHGQVVGRLGKSMEDAQPFLWTQGKIIKIGSPGGRMGIASQINDNGQVCGTIDPLDGNPDPHNKRHAFLWRNRHLTRLDTLQVRTFDAVGINSEGDIVGTASFNASPGHIFVWQQGKMLEFLPASGIGSNPCALNDTDQVVGSCDKDAVVWMNGPASAKIIGPGCAQSINNHGQVVGNSGENAFLWQGGVRTDLTMLGRGGYSTAFGINDQGQIVGLSCPVIKTGKYNHAVLWQNGQVYDLNSLIPSGSKYEIVVGDAINNRGQILCSAILNGKSHTVILTPKK
jgi:probable HAF family extracellular repeat protein